MYCLKECGDFSTQVEPSHSAELGCYTSPDRGQRSKGVFLLVMVVFTLFTEAAQPNTVNELLLGNFS